MTIRRIGLLAGLGLAAAIVIVPASAASAGTVSSSIGTVTASQHGPLGGCDDFGAAVDVSVTAGLAGASYTAAFPGVFGSPVTFTTNAAGSGAVELHNVPVPPNDEVGTATITVAHGSTSVQVPATVQCSNGKGD